MKIYYGHWTQFGIELKKLGSKRKSMKRVPTLNDSEWLFLFGLQSLTSYSSVPGLRCVPSQGSGDNKDAHTWLSWWTCLLTAKEWYRRTYRVFHMRLEWRLCGSNMSDGIKAWILVFSFTLTYCLCRLKLMESLSCTQELSVYVDLQSSIYLIMCRQISICSLAVPEILTRVRMTAKLLPDWVTQYQYAHIYSFLRTWFIWIMACNSQVAHTVGVFLI